MTPVTLNHRLRSIIGELELLDKQTVADWPVVARYLIMIAQELREFPEPANTAYRVFQGHCVKILEGAVQIMMRFSAEDESARAIVLPVIGNAIAGLRRTMENCSLFQEELCDD